MPGTELTQEQVLGQLRTRGFSRGGGSPLRWFRGKLDRITGAMDMVGNMTEARLRINYNFSEVEVFDSTEPYTAPVAQILIWHSSSPTSGMGALGKSMDKIINADVDENTPQDQVKNQDFLIGRVQEWKFTPGHMVYDRDARASVPTECWEVVYVEGVGGTPHSGVAIEAEPEVASAPAPVAKVATKPVAKKAPATKVTPNQQALNLLVGKTQQQFNNVVFQDPLVKSSPDLVMEIVNGTFISSLEDAGVVVKDENGVYSKV